MTPDFEARLRALALEWWGEDADGHCAHRKPEEEQRRLDTIWGEHPVEWLLLFAQDVAALAAQEQRERDVKMAEGVMFDGLPIDAHRRGFDSARQKAAATIRATAPDEEKS